MTDEQLQAQFERCKQWNDPDQWDVLGIFYFVRGYELNAMFCFMEADSLREKSAVLEG